MKRNTLLYLILIVLLTLLTVANLCIGSIVVPFREIIQIITAKADTSVNAQIITSIRLPRIVAAAMLGGALSLSGYMLQNFFRNSIAGPFVLGISSGAKLLVAMLMVFSLRFGFYVNSIGIITAAFTGALIVTFLVLIVSRKVNNMSILIVCGVMVGYICSAVTELIISFADDANIVNLHSWSMGSFSSISWKNAGCFSTIAVLGFIACFFLSKQMEAYSYGEDYARSLGVNVRSLRFILIILSSILSATVTAFAGPISFVGIAVPHMARVIFKSDKPIIIVPAVFIGGAIFCLFCDLLARMLFSPMELSISTITAIFGAPIVVIMLVNRKK